jgi:hypothetical protein
MRIAIIELINNVEMICISEFPTSSTLFGFGKL